MAKRIYGSGVEGGRGRSRPNRRGMDGVVSAMRVDLRAGESDSA